jgi:Ras-related GTP-binding protein C/D
MMDPYSSEPGEDEGVAYSDFPNDMGYGEDLTGLGDRGSVLDDSKPRILLTGLRRAGKTSIQKVVFSKLSPNETLLIEHTEKITKTDVSNSMFVQFQIWDFSGDFDFEDPGVDAELLFKQCGAVVFVIDAQDNYDDALARLHSTVVRAFQVNPQIKFEVFVHKVDNLSDDRKFDVQREIQQQALEELSEAKVTGIHMSFHMTSIYDHSIFEAFSKVVQKLIPQLATMESLLDILIASCRMEKAFLIDTLSKIYVATDSSPVDTQTLELCSDMIDVVIDVSCIYGSKYDSSSPSSHPSGLDHDPETQSVIKLDTDNILYLREVHKYLALVCLLRSDKFDKHGLVDYNFQTFKKAVAQVFEVGNKASTTAPAASSSNAQKK